MSYYKRGRVSINFESVIKIGKPIISIILYSSIFLGFLIFSYEFILGDHDEQAKSNIPEQAETVAVSGESKVQTPVVENAESNIPLDVSIKTIKVYLNDEGRFVELNLEEYVKGVVCSEMPLNFNKEALKAQAIVARTYAISHAMEGGCSKYGGDVCDTVHCQVYTSKDTKTAQLGALGESRWDLVEAVVNETEGMVLSYDGAIATGAFYFSTSSGRTENVEEVFSTAIPYLRSVESLGEEVAPRYTSTETYDLNRFVQIVNSSFSKANLAAANLSSQISINSYTGGGAVKEITLGGATISGVEFRKIFGLNSANFSLEFLSNQVNINCKGFGHGVGMSQWGANVMAGEGKSCEEILKHYYTGINIDKINN
ncbi:MAG: stage II sporulation protein D [Clostridium sp.]|nr:stage II sporulation protein D [Clostridium sp.]MDU7086016.1 stage II sporulation protein D [Clostridium sp.]